MVTFVDGTRLIIGDDGIDVISGDADTNEISGNGGNDVLYGRGNSDTLLGGAGNDKLYGGAGFDQLQGGDGNDILFTGRSPNSDWLDGGRGKDVLVLEYLPRRGVTGHAAVIQKFNVADDTIWLDNVMMKALGGGTLAKPVKLKADAFYVASYFQVRPDLRKGFDAQDRVIYDRSTGQLFYDPDGSGSKKETLIAQTVAKLKLTHHDFFVV